MQNSFAGAAPGYRYADEFAALCDADCVAAVQRSGYALGGYADALNDSRVMAREAAPPRRDGEIARRVVPARRAGSLQRFRLPSRYPAARNQPIASSSACR